MADPQIIRLPQSAWYGDTPIDIDFPGTWDVTVCHTRGHDATRLSSPLLKSSGGDMVIIAVTPEGQMTHYLGRTFGENIGGRTWFSRATLPPNTSRLTMLVPYPDKIGADWTADYRLVNHATTWDKVRRMLEQTYGTTAKVAVIPDATSQYFPNEPKRP